MENKYLCHVQVLRIQYSIYSNFKQVRSDMYQYSITTSKTKVLLIQQSGEKVCEIEKA